MVSDYQQLWESESWVISYLYWLGTNFFHWVWQDIINPVKNVWIHLRDILLIWSIRKYIFSPGIIRYHGCPSTYLNQSLYSPFGCKVAAFIKLYICKSETKCTINSFFAKAFTKDFSWKKKHFHPVPIHFTNLDYASI